MTEAEVIAKLIALDHQIQLLSVMVREFIHELRDDLDESLDIHRDSVVE